jgi:hypothetical protein
MSRIGVIGGGPADRVGYCSLLSMENLLDSSWWPKISMETTNAVSGSLHLQAFRRMKTTGRCAPLEKRQTLERLPGSPVLVVFPCFLLALRCSPPRATAVPEASS